MSGANGVDWGPKVGIGPTGTYEFPSDPGVYVFAEETAAGIIVRYVGRTDDLRQRINDHLAGSDNDCLRRVLDDTTNVKIRVTVQGSKEIQKNIEHTCYVHYLSSGHLCNDVEPEGRDLGENSLPF